jgi:hypothetical protein
MVGTWKSKVEESPGFSPNYRCCWFTGQRLSTSGTDERTTLWPRARPLALGISTGQLAVLFIPLAYAPDRPLPLANMTRKCGANPKRNSLFRPRFPDIRWAEPCHYGGPCANGPLLSIIAKLFLRKHFRETHSTAQRAHPLVQDVSPREARQDPIAEATESASGIIFRSTAIMN